MAASSLASLSRTVITRFLSLVRPPVFRVGRFLALAWPGTAIGLVVAATLVPAYAGFCMGTGLGTSRRGSALEPHAGRRSAAAPEDQRTIAKVYIPPSSTPRSAGAPSTSLFRNHRCAAAWLPTPCIHTIRRVRFSILADFTNRSCHEGVRAQCIAAQRGPERLATTGDEGSRRLPLQDYAVVLGWNTPHPPPPERARVCDRLPETLPADWELDEDSSCPSVWRTRTTSASPCFRGPAAPSSRSRWPQRAARSSGTERSPPGRRHRPDHRVGRCQPSCRPAAPQPRRAAPTGPARHVDKVGVLGANPQQVGRRTGSSDI